MELKQDTFQDKVVGAEKEMEFSIDTDSSVIFEILRDKMYKDKIGSICREVASNARDANREAGSDKPVEIEVIKPNKLLSVGHPSISFKDYGFGITPSRMEDIYLKYGASNKRSDNIQTGGFGLGAKTPFAYNDTFTVITVCDVDGKRMKYKYTAMIDSSQKGKMVCFSKEEVDEPTGTTVIVPINTDVDVHKFEKESLKYTKTWGDEIVYKGFELTQEEFDLAYENEDFIVYNTRGYRYNSVELLVDGIPYPLDREMVNINDTIGRANSEYLTIIKFNTGELTISANRESVQYDEETIQAIEAKFLKVKEKMDELMVSHMENCETYTEACVFTYYVNRKSSPYLSPSALVGAILAHSKSTSFKLKNKTWNGWATTDKFMFQHHTIFRVTLDNGRNKYEPSYRFDLNESNINTPIVYGDVRKNASRNVNLWEEGHDAFYLITPKDGDSKEGIEEFMTFIYSFDFDFDIYSELEPIRSESKRGVYQKQPYVNLKIRTVDQWGFINKETISIDREDYTTDDFDLSKVVYASVESITDAEYCRERHDLKFLAKRGYTCFIIRNQDYDNWLQHTEMRHFKNVLETEREQIIKENKGKALDFFIYEILQDVFNYDYKRYKEVLEPILPESCKNIEPDGISSEEARIVKKELKFDFDGLKKKLNSIFDEYPLLNAVMNSYRIKGSVTDAIALYIKQVDCYNGK